MEYKSKNISINYNAQDESSVKDIEKAVIEGKNKITEYLGITEYDKEIIINVYSSIEQLHLETFGEKREEWLVCCRGEKENILKVVSPLNSGKEHNYQAILKIISKSVADIILNENFKNLPAWLDITTYVTGLNTKTNTFSKPSIKKFKEKDHFNYSDCYFITRFIVERFGKDTILKILNNPDKYNEILNLTDEEIDLKLEEYYGKNP